MDRERNQCGGKPGRRLLWAHYAGHRYIIRFDNTPDGWNKAADQLLAWAMSPNVPLPLEIAEQAIDWHWMQYYAIYGTGVKK
jgi:hypothetical protein